MKRALVLTIIGFFMFSLQNAEANYGSDRSLNTAKGRTQVAQSKNAKQEYKVKNRQQATQLVKEKYRAKVLSVQAIKVDGNPAYKAKLLGNDGIVFYVYIDASSGRMRRG
jgi:uncharacterized membrane protein YkoI